MGDPGGADDVTVRSRHESDIPALADALMAQQPLTGYPFRNPLPFPVSDFLHASDATAAWTAVMQHRPVGHIARIGPARGFPEADELNGICAREHGCDVADLTWVTAFFVATEARGLGVGRRLLETLVDDVEAHGQRACLEVLSTHTAAVSLYRATGWREVHRLVPEWLRAAAGNAGPEVSVLVLDR